MRKYSPVHIPVLSFYSMDLYRDVYFNWKGTGFLFLFLLLMVCWIPSMVKMHFLFANFCRNYAPMIIMQVPQITFCNGKANVEVSQPYEIIDLKTQNPLITIDTTGKLTSLHDTSALVLVKKTEAIFRYNDIETRSFSYNKLNYFVLNKNKLFKWLESARKYFYIVLYPFALTVSFVYRAIQILICAAIGMLFSSWCRLSKDYGSLIRLSVIAVTPVIIISSLLGIAGIYIPFSGLLFFLTAMIYLFISIRVCSRDNAYPEHLEEAQGEFTLNSDPPQDADVSHGEKWF